MKNEDVSGYIRLYRKLKDNERREKKRKKYIVRIEIWLRVLKKR